ANRMVVPSGWLQTVDISRSKYCFKRSAGILLSGRGSTLTFYFQGKAIESKPGDTIAAALYRNGQRVFTRSFKYHRPRGLFCVAGKCPNCLMNVNGVPNVRTCITPACDGQNVKAQNAFPSLETDFLSITQHFDWMMPVGWYYKTLTHPAVWRAAEP